MLEKCLQFEVAAVGIDAPVSGELARLAGKREVSCSAKNLFVCHTDSRNGHVQ